MTKLLEIKDRVIRFYSRLEMYLKPVLKFIGALILYLMINANIGYMSKISNVPVALILALIGCLLPSSVTVLIASAVVLLDLYALSAEVALIGLVLLLLVLIVYFRFTSRAGVMALVTPILCKWNIPYAIPVGTGLVRKPYAIIPSICGTVVFYFLHGVKQSASALTTVVEGEETTNYTVSLNQLVANKEMYLFIALFVITTLVVYFVRRMNADHSWTIAIVSGVLIQLVGFFIGFMVFDISGKSLSLILGNIIALLVGFVLEFIFMNLDYARTERVQFEDDDYYYYVKAVPKKMVASKEVSVKRFSNTTVMAKKVDHSKPEETEEQENISRKVIAKELDIDEDWLK